MDIYHQINKCGGWNKRIGWKFSKLVNLGGGILVSSYHKIPNLMKKYPNLTNFEWQKLIIKLKNDIPTYTVKPGVSKLFLVNNLALVNIFCFPKSHFQHKSPIDSKQPGVSKLFAA